MSFMYFLSAEQGTTSSTFYEGNCVWGKDGIISYLIIKTLVEKINKSVRIYTNFITSRVTSRTFVIQTGYR